MLRRIELWDEVRKEFSPDGPDGIKNKKIVHERCPKCRHEKMRHFDIRDIHYRECASSECDYAEKLELWELTCSCGKEPDEKSGNVKIKNCAASVKL